MSHSGEGHTGSASDCKACESEYRESISGHAENDGRRGPCFPYSALVDTPNGHIPIGSLHRGDQVFTYYEGELRVRRITRKLSHPPARIVKVSFTTSDLPIFCTATHTFLSHRGWKTVEELKPGDFVRHASQARLRQIHDVVSTGKVEPIFNIYTQFEHTFIVNDCVAHNFTHFRWLRTAVHSMLFDSFIDLLEPKFDSPSAQA